MLCDLDVFLEVFLTLLLVILTQLRDNCVNKGVLNMYDRGCRLWCSLIVIVL